MCQAWSKCLHELQHLIPTSLQDWFSYSSHFPHWEAEVQRSQMRIGRQLGFTLRTAITSLCFCVEHLALNCLCKTTSSFLLFPHAHSSLLGTAAQSCRQVRICRHTHPDSPSSSQSLIASFPLAGPLCSAAQVNISSWIPCTQDLLDQKLPLPPANKPSHSLKDMSHLTHPASPPHTQIPFTGPDPSAHTNHTRPQSKIQIP